MFIRNIGIIATVVLCSIGCSVTSEPSYVESSLVSQLAEARVKISELEGTIKQEHTDHRIEIDKLQSQLRVQKGISEDRLYTMECLSRKLRKLPWKQCSDCYEHNIDN